MVESSSGKSDSWESTPNRKSIAVLALEELEILLDGKVNQAFMDGIKFSKHTIINAEKKLR